MATITTMMADWSAVLHRWGLVVHLMMSPVVISMSRIKVTMSSMGWGSISVVMSMFVVSGTSMSTNVVVSVLVVKSILRRMCSMVSGYAMVAGFLVIVVGFFVSGTLNERQYTFTWNYPENTIYAKLTHTYPHETESIYCTFQIS